MSTAARWDWNIAVCCRNEQEAIAKCIAGIADAAHGRRCLTTLVVNGSTDASAEVALETAARRGLPIAVHSIATADKANALNHFFSSLRQDARHYMFVDAHVAIGPRSLATLEHCLETNADAVAATGVCTNGRTMLKRSQTALAEGGQLHGQLHALRPDFVNRLVTRKIRLPIGLYYGDGLMCSMASHDLDPMNLPWENGRIASHPDATYEIQEMSPYRMEDIQRQLRRKVRQMRGKLQNAAIKDLIYKHGYEGLPEFADDMVTTFLTTHDLPKVSLFDRPFLALALKEIRGFRRPDPRSLQPELVRRLG